MSRKIKILIFIDWFLPAYKAGGPVRSVANMIDALQDIYDFFIVTKQKSKDLEFAEIKRLFAEI